MLNGSLRPVAIAFLAVAVPQRGSAARRARRMATHRDLHRATAAGGVDLAPTGGRMLASAVDGTHVASLKLGRSRSLHLSRCSVQPTESSAIMRRSGRVRGWQMLGRIPGVRHGWQQAWSAVGLVLVALLLGAPSAMADEGSIFFSAYSFPAHSWGVFRMGATTGQPITEVVPGEVRGLGVSPDGSTVAYARPDGKLYLNNALGTNERPIQPVADPDARFSELRFVPTGASVVGIYDGALGRGVYSVDLDGTDLHRLVEAWPGVDLHSPVVSSVGRLAFRANGLPEGRNYSAVPPGMTPLHLWIVDGPGAHPRPVTDPTEQRNVYAPSFAGDGHHLFFGATNLAGAPWTYQSSEPFTGSTPFPPGSINTGDDVEWDIDGQGADQTVVTGGDSHIDRSTIAAGANTNLLSGTGSGGSDTVGDSNVLLTQGGDPLAYANPDLGWNPLSLSTLDPYSYPWLGGPAPSASDKLNARGNNEDTYADDANRLRTSNPDFYANQTYAQARSDERTGDLWLQYWFFYYNNPQNVMGVGAHEGDWELMQIRLDGNRAPQEVVYGQHTSGTQERCPWSLVEKDSSDPDVPIVYVANASHANYLVPGPHPRTFPEPTDITDGRVRARPKVNRVVDGSPGWAFWPGNWTGGGDEIRGPGAQENKWYHPATFAAGARDCPGASGRRSTLTGADGAAAVRHQRMRAARERALAAEAKVGMPVITASRVPGGIRIGYRLPRKTRHRTKMTILLTATARDHLAGPSGHAFHVAGRRGVRTIPTPRGTGPYRVHASLLLRDGSRGAIATAIAR